MYSKHIDDFLRFLREAKQEYDIAMLGQSETEKETQDILHAVELDQNTYHEHARLSKTLKEVREERRKAKDKREQLEPIIDWTEENEKTVKELERLLGEVRKIEKKMKNRTYIPRTEILKKVKGTKNEKA